MTDQATVPPPPPASDSGFHRRQRYCPCSRCRLRGFLGPTVLITVGAIFLASELIERIEFRDWWPVILIVIGVMKLLEHTASAEGHRE